MNSDVGGLCSYPVLCIYKWLTTRQLKEEVTKRETIKERTNRIDGLIYHQYTFVFSIEDKEILGKITRRQV